MAVRGYPEAMTAPFPPLPGPPDPGEARTSLTLAAADDGPEILRADAARNRALLLDAASRLLADCGAADLTMESVAAAAGVGKGTVFRRFKDRTGLLIALLDHREALLQSGLPLRAAPHGSGRPGSRETARLRPRRDAP